MISTLTNISLVSAIRTGGDINIKNKPIKYDETIQILEFNMSYDRDLIIKSINYHIKNENLTKTKDNYIKLVG